MSNFTNKTVTAEGARIVAEVLANSNTFKFTRIALGSGSMNLSDIISATSLQDERISLDIASMAHKNNQCHFNALLLGSNVSTPFEWTEVGLFGEDKDGNEILYFYAINSEVDTISNGIGQKIIQIVTYLSSNANVTATLTPTLEIATLEITSGNRQLGVYTGETDTSIDITPSKIGAQLQLTQVKTIELGRGLGVDAQDVCVDFHANDKNNPDYSARLIAPAGSNNLVLKTGGSNGVVEVDGTLTCKGKEVFNNGDVIPASNGGTGLNSITKGSLVVGNGADALSELNGLGALYATSKGSPQFGILPIGIGGTGVSSFIEGSVLLGNNTGTFQQKTGIGAFHASVSGQPTFGTLPTTAGGTGRAKLTKGAVIVGNDEGVVQEKIGTGAFYSKTSGQPTFGTLPTNLGGTGRTSYTANGLVFATNSSTLGQLAAPNTEGILYCSPSSAPKYITLDELADMLKNKIGGDIMGKKIAHEYFTVPTKNDEYSLVKSFANAKGGMVRIPSAGSDSAGMIFKLIIDGETVLDNVKCTNLLGWGDNSHAAHFFDFSFNKNFQLYVKYGNSTATLALIYYLNQ